MIKLQPLIDIINSLNPQTEVDSEVRAQLNRLLTEVYEDGYDNGFEDCSLSSSGTYEGKFDW